jgi:phosphate butyryltransferase
MIRTLDDVRRLAKDKGPMRLAVLAPEDTDFMLAIKKSWQNGYTEPVLIGSKEKMERVAAEVEFDIGHIEKFFETDRQAIADRGTAMLFTGDVDIESKGQISTSYVFRSIIKEELKAGTGKMINAISLWEIPGLDHLIAFTDTGANVNPDYQAKVEIIKNVVFLFHLLGYPRPRISALSGQREIGDSVNSYHDAGLLKKAAASGDLGECEVLDATSFSDIFLGQEGRFKTYRNMDILDLPEILLVPNLDTGNILAKLDFLLNVTRYSLVISSKGPIITPSRSDPSSLIMGEITMGVVVADKMKGDVSLRS